MRRFMNQLKNGLLVISYCSSCRKKVWPPYENCPVCYRRTSALSAGKLGRIVEFSRSWLEEGEVFVALIDMDGILLLGSISDGRRIAVGAEVELVTTGVSPEGKIHFHFRILDRFDSYTIVNNIFKTCHELR
jgi:uncharacterized OB-fold protein